jgi:hypothetical protein
MMAVCALVLNEVAAGAAQDDRREEVEESERY